MRTATVSLPYWLFPLGTLLFLAGVLPAGWAAFIVRPRLAPPDVAPADAAPRWEVESIVTEINAVPASGLTGARKPALDLKALPPFSAKVLADYRADYASPEDLDRQLRASPERFKLRQAVRSATAVLQENSVKFKMRTRFAGATTTAAVKKLILQEQTSPAKSILFLQEALEELRQVEAQRGQEKSKRWQAHYDYVLARLMTQLVLVYEYNGALGRIRADQLPVLAQGETGWELVGRERPLVTDTKTKQLAKEVARLWEKIAKEYPGTPWALAAERERQLLLGLEWQPIRGKEAALPRPAREQRQTAAAPAARSFGLSCGTLRPPPPSARGLRNA
jgi:hypothetical protein